MAIQINGSTGVSGVNGTGANPVYSGGDSDTGIFFPALGQVAITTDGVQRLLITETGSIQSASALSFPAGSASAPSVTFTGDTDTGIYSPSANSVAISTGGSGRLFVDASGNVGVGAASTGSDLRVAGLTGTSILEVFGADTDGFADLEIKSTGTSGASRLYFSDTAAQSGLIRYSHNTNSLEFSTAGSERLRITSAGLVGVGTSSPVATLHVDGSGNQNIRVSSTTHSNFIQAGCGSGSTYHEYKSVYRLVDTDNGERLRITSAGLVGIGASVPQAKLEVVGGTNAIYSLRDTGNGGLSITDFGGGVAFGTSSGGSAAYIGGSIQIRADQTWTAGSSHPSNLIFSIAASGSTTPTERLRITSAGLVGIGTTTPQSLLNISTAATPGDQNVLICGTASSGINGSHALYLGAYGSTQYGCKIKAIYNYAGSVGTALSFEVSNNAGTLIEAARIDSSGRLGVGTSVPGTKVEIVDGTDNNHLTLYKTGVAGGAGPGIRFNNQNNTGGSAYIAAITTELTSGTPSQEAGALVLSTRSTSDATPQKRIYVSAAGQVGIGTTSPGYALDIQGSQGVGLQIYETSSGNNRRLRITQESAGVTYDATFSTSNNTHRWLLGGSEAARLDANGRLLVGTSSARQNLFNTTYSALLQVESQTTGNAQASFTSSTAGINGANLILCHQRSGSSGGNTIVQAEDQVGIVSFQGADGTEMVPAASVEVYVDGTPGANDMPGRLVFSTTADGASSPTERMRINNQGGVSGFAAGGWDNYVASNSSAAGTSVTFYNGRHSATGTFTGTNSYYVWTNGNVQNTNGSYTAISDAKLKENIVDAGSQWNDLKAIRIRNWNFKAETGHETHRQIGPIAQELETVCPGLVFATPDRDEDGNETGDVTKGVNQSVLYMKAVKALQEAMERIETLEAENAHQKASLTDILSRISALEGA